jgi:hypothetical protein
VQQFVWARLSRSSLAARFRAFTIIAGDILEPASNRVNQKQLSFLEDNNRRGLAPCLACKSAPKWDPAESEINLRFISAILEAGVPIGAGWDPTNLSF